jgi:hypothetical protein
MDRNVGLLSERFQMLQAIPVGAFADSRFLSLLEAKPNSSETREVSLMQLLPQRFTSPPQFLLFQLFLKTR